MRCHFSGYLFRISWLAWCCQSVNNFRTVPRLLWLPEWDFIQAFIIGRWLMWKCLSGIPDYAGYGMSVSSNYHPYRRKSLHLWLAWVTNDRLRHHVRIPRGWQLSFYRIVVGNQSLPSRIVNSAPVRIGIQFMESPVREAKFDHLQWAQSNHPQPCRSLNIKSVSPQAT